jgi:protein ImuB
LDRLACVDLPAFPLQLLLRHHPAWSAWPVAVIAEDKPQARILWVNEHARRARVLPGMRYAAGLSLATDLRAAPITSQEVQAAVVSLTEVLRNFTPHVEPASERFGLTIGPGVFWLNASGLLRLYPSLQHWAREIRHGIETLGYTTSIAIGFTRFGTYAVAKANPDTLVCFTSPEAEHHAARAVPLSRIEIDPDARDNLGRLGVDRVGDLMGLAPGDLRERFDPSVAAWHALANDALWAPLEPAVSPTPVQRVVILEHGEVDSTRLLFLIKRELHGMLAELSRRHEAAMALQIRARIDRRERYVEHVRPAARTASWWCRDVSWPCLSSWRDVTCSTSTWTTPATSKMRTSTTPTPFRRSSPACMGSMPMRS